MEVGSSKSKLNKKIDSEDKIKSANTAKMMKPKSRQIDGIMLGLIAVLCLIGIVMVFSTTYYANGMTLVTNQIKALVLGTLVMILVSFVDYHALTGKTVNYNGEKVKMRNWSIVFLVVAFLLCLAVNQEINGAKRWLRITETLSFQPSELLKYALVLFMSGWMVKTQKDMGKLVGVLPKIILAAGLSAMLLFVQKNLSSALIIFAITLIMLFIGNANVKQLIVISAILGVGAFLVVKATSWRTGRIDAFFDPWSDPKDKGYQIIQALYAISSGGLFGNGLNQGRQSLLYLSQRESDMIFAIIAEEFGFVGAVAVLLLFLWLIWRGIKAAINCRDLEGRYMALGIVCIIAFQVIINTAVATKAMPNTGQTLPFISYGGTSLVITMAACGVLLNISKNSDYKKGLSIFERKTKNTLKK